MSERIVMEETFDKPNPWRISLNDLIRIMSGLGLYCMSLAAFIWILRQVSVMYTRYILTDTDFFVGISSAALFLHVLTAIFIIKEVYDTWTSRNS